MKITLDDRYVVDILASEAGGYFAAPTADSVEYTNLLMDVCRQFHIRYYSASAKEKNFVEEVTRVTWENRQKKITGDLRPIRPSFTA